MGMLLRLAVSLFADRWLTPAAVPAIAAAAISAGRQSGGLKDREHRAARCFCTNA